MATENSKVRQIRIDNIQNTQKRIQRLLSSIYVLSVLLIVAWFSSNFESTELSEKIGELDRALAIEELRNWDNYLYRVSSCFDEFFFGFGGKLVDRDKFKSYIDHYTAENERLSSFIDAGQQGRYPIDKLQDIYNSDDHWSDFRFWSQQDTLVSFLFSLEYLVGWYMHERWGAIYSSGIHPFLDSVAHINLSADSALVTLYGKLDSLKNPLSYAVKVGWNPFVQGERHSFYMWERWRDFDDYSTYEIESCIDILHRLNMISYFREVFKDNRQLLELIGSDLERVAYESVIIDSISFSTEESDIEYFKLQQILESKLWDRIELPDSIQIKKILNLSIEYNNISPRDISGGLKAFYPDFMKVLEKYKLDRISGIKNLRSILESQRQFGQQRLQAFGAEISYNTVILIIPPIVVALYWLAYIFVHHLRKIISTEDRIMNREELREVGNAPLITMLRPLKLAIILTVLPGFVTGFVVIDQIGLVGHRSPFANNWNILFVEVATITAMILMAKNIWFLSASGGTSRGVKSPKKGHGNISAKNVEGVAEKHLKGGNRPNR